MDARFAALFATLYIAHMIGDYWVQTDWQARRKGDGGMVGRFACAAHVATYTATIIIVVVIVSYRLNLDLSFPRVTVALVVSAVTHYVTDRISPLRRMAVACRHSRAWLDSGGLTMVDQAWHMGWLGVAALIMA